VSEAVELLVFFLATLGPVAVGATLAYLRRPVWWGVVAVFLISVLAAAWVGLNIERQLDEDPHAYDPLSYLLLPVIAFGPPIFAFVGSLAGAQLRRERKGD
jgi:hypothetical protein